MSADPVPAGPCPICGCNEPVHHWFGLSYSKYLVVQRSVLEAMPVDWQGRFVGMLEEMREIIDTDKLHDKFKVLAVGERGRFVTDPHRDYRRGPRVPMRKAVADGR